MTLYKNGRRCLVIFNVYRFVSRWSCIPCWIVKRPFVISKNNIPGVRYFIKGVILSCITFNSKGPESCLSTDIIKNGGKILANTFSSSKCKSYQLITVFVQDYPVYTVCTIFYVRYYPNISGTYFLTVSIKMRIYERSYIGR